MTNETTTDAATANGGRVNGGDRGGDCSMAGQPRLVCRMVETRDLRGESQLVLVSSDDFRGRRGREAAPLLWGDVLLRRLRATGLPSEDSKLPEVLSGSCDPGRRRAAMSAFQAESIVGRGEPRNGARGWRRG
jgi:hypothetical protein